MDYSSGETYLWCGTQSKLLHSNGLLGTTRRSRDSRHQNQNTYPYGPYDSFNADPQSYGYSGHTMYDQSGPPIFEDTSRQQFAGVGYDPYGGPAFNPSPMFNPNASTAGNLFNQQILLTAGQQILNNPMAAAAIDQYGQNLVTKGKSWVGANVCPLFPQWCSSYLDI